MDNVDVLSKTTIAQEREGMVTSATSIDVPSAIHHHRQLTADVVLVGQPLTVSHYLYIDVLLEGWGTHLND